ALAGAVVLLLAGGGAFAWWAENRHRDERERLSRNADAVTALLDQCEDALRADNAEKAELARAQAKKRLEEGAAGHLADRLARCVTDLDMVQELDRIDDLRWAAVEGRSRGDAKALAEWPEAFGRFGIAPGRTTPEEAAARV